MSSSTIAPAAITDVLIERGPGKEKGSVSVKVAATVNGKRIALAFLEKSLGMIPLTAQDWRESLFALAWGLEMRTRWLEALPDTPREKVGMYQRGLPRDVEEHIEFEPKEWEDIRPEFRILQSFK